MEILGAFHQQRQRSLPVVCVTESSIVKSTYRSCNAMPLTAPRGNNNGSMVVREERPFRRGVADG